MSLSTRQYVNLLNGESKISLTGDKQVDADIAAFVNARKKILTQMKRRFINLL
jgi:hypothetical protein